MMKAIALLSLLILVALVSYYFGEYSAHTSAVEGVVNEPETASYYLSKIYQPSMKLNNDSKLVACTMVLSTYKRAQMLPEILGHYCDRRCSILSEIVVVWHDPVTPIPSSVFQLRDKCSKKMEILPMKENKLTNRFLPQNLAGIDNTNECEFLVNLFSIAWQQLKHNETIDKYCIREWIGNFNFSRDSGMPTH